MRGPEMMKWVGRGRRLVAHLLVGVVGGVVLFVAAAIGPVQLTEPTGLAPEPAVAQDCPSWGGGGCGDFFEDVGDWFGDVFESIGNFFSNAWNWIVGIFTGNGGGGSGWDSGWDDGWDDGGFDMEALGDQAEAAAEQADEEAFAEYQQWVEDLESDASGVLSNACDEATATANEMADLANEIDAVISDSNVDQLLSDVEDAGHPNLPSAGDLESAMQDLQSVWADLDDLAGTAAGAADEICSLANNFSLSEFLGDPWDGGNAVDAVNAALADLDEFGSNLNGAAQEAEGFAQDAAGYIDDADAASEALEEELANALAAEALLPALESWCEASQAMVDAAVDAAAAVEWPLWGPDGVEDTVAAALSVDPTHPLVIQLQAALSDAESPVFDGPGDLQAFADEICDLWSSWETDLDSGYVPDPSEVDNAVDDLNAWLTDLDNGLADLNVALEATEGEVLGLEAQLQAWLDHLEALAGVEGPTDDTVQPCSGLILTPIDGLVLQQRSTETDSLDGGKTATLDTRTFETRLLTSSEPTRTSTLSYSKTTLTLEPTLLIPCRAKWDRLDVFGPGWNLMHEGSSSAESRRLIVRALTPEAEAALAGGADLSTGQLNALLNQLEEDGELQIIAHNGVLMIDDPEDVDSFISAVFTPPAGLEVDVVLQPIDLPVLPLGATDSAGFETTLAAYASQAWEGVNREFDIAGVGPSTRGAIRSGFPDSGFIRIRIGPNNYNPAFVTVGNLRSVLVHEYYHRAQHLAFAAAGPWFIGDQAGDGAALELWKSRNIEAPTFRFQMNHPSWDNVTTNFAAMIEGAGTNQYDMDSEAITPVPGGLQFFHTVLGAQYELGAAVTPAEWEAMFNPDF